MHQRAGQRAPRRRCARLGTSITVSEDHFPASDRLSRRYRGSRGDSPSAPALVTVEDGASGELLGPLTHLLTYSPTGLNWGYVGAGPRELARCLLAAVLGERARSPTGSAGLRRDLPEHELVSDVVSRLPARWLLTDQALLGWIGNERPDLLAGT